MRYIESLVDGNTLTTQRGFKPQWSPNRGCTPPKPKLAYLTHTQHMLDPGFSGMCASTAAELGL